MKRSLTIGLVAILTMIGFSSAASALTYSGTRYGQYTVTRGRDIFLTDNQPDGRFPSVIYKYNGGTRQSSLVNQSGYRTTVHLRVRTNITAIRPCISRSAPLPMSCGGWIY